jgi:hypothetical protein
MSDNHEVSWEREAIELPSSNSFRNIEPSGTTNLTCTCGWTKQVPNSETQQASEDHQSNPDA